MPIVAIGFDLGPRPRPLVPPRPPFPVTGFGFGIHFHLHPRPFICGRVLWGLRDQRSERSENRPHPHLHQQISRLKHVNHVWPRPGIPLWPLENLLRTPRGILGIPLISGMWITMLTCATWAFSERLSIIGLNMIYGFPPIFWHWWRILWIQIMVSVAFP